MLCISYSNMLTFNNTSTEPPFHKSSPLIFSCALFPISTFQNPPNISGNISDILLYFLFEKLLSVLSAEQFEPPFCNLWEQATQPNSKSNHTSHQQWNHQHTDNKHNTFNNVKAKIQDINLCICNLKKSENSLTMQRKRFRTRESLVYL